MEVRFHDPVRQSALISQFITCEAGRPSITTQPRHALALDLAGLSQFANPCPEEFYSLLNDRVQVTVDTKDSTGLIEMELSADVKLTYEGELLIEGAKMWLHGKGRLEAWVDGVRITSIGCDDWRRNEPMGEVVIENKDGK